MTDKTKEVNPWADTEEEKDVFESSGKKDIVNLKMTEGDTVIRVKGTHKVLLEHWITRSNRSVICPVRGCPMCNHPERAKLKQIAEKTSDDRGSEDKATKAAWRKYFSYEPNKRYAINVIHRSDSTMKVWRFSRTMKQNIEAIVGKYGDPNGYDLIVTRRGTKKEDTKYTVMPAPKSDELTEEEKALQPLNLAMIYKPTSADKILALMRGEKISNKGAPTEVEAAPKTELPKDLEDDLKEEEIEDIV